MRNRLLSTTASIGLGIALLGTPLALNAADEASTSSEATITTTTTIEAESLIGKDIENADGDTIGEIESVVIDQNGRVHHVVVSVGGFLGMGDRNVALTLDSLDIANDGEDVTTRFSKEQLEALPEHRYPDSGKRGVYSYEEDVRTNAYLADTDGGRNSNMIDADELVGADVENSDGDTIGDVESVVIDKDGNVRHVIVGVGGFLGMGERNVALAWDSLRIDENGERVRSNLTKAQLEALPEHRYPENVKAGVYGYDDDVRTNPYLADQMSDGGVRGDSREQASHNDYADGAKAPNDTAISVSSGSLQASEIVGVDVKTSQGDSIGEVDEILLGRSGEVNGLVVDVGGFLGVGERSVIVDWKDIDIRQDDDEIQVTMAMTKDQLNTLPEYKKSRAAN